MAVCLHVALIVNYRMLCRFQNFLIRDTGAKVIANSMQLIAGRSAQE
jgi:hypothetical protein